MPFARVVRLDAIRMPTAARRQVLVAIEEKPISSPRG
jgi:hypothetical protein